METANGGMTKEALTRDRICEAALQAIDEAGLEAVSMRMLAASLGVKASSLYYHFESKDELLDEVAEFLYAELAHPPSGGEWVEQVRWTFTQLHTLIQVHPNAAALLVRGIASSTTLEERALGFLEAACRAGVDPARATRLVGNLVALIVGHTLLSLWVHDGSRGEDGGSRDARGETGRPAWVRELLQVPVPGEVGPQGLGGSESPASLVHRVSDDDDVQAGSHIYQSPAGVVASATVLTTDSVFMDGLNALIRGFAPD